ncbi:MAG: hypothetical protein ACXW1S_07950 [Acidimicrobiia bacterium]
MRLERDGSPDGPLEPEVLAGDVAAGAEGFVLPFTDFGTPATLEHFMTEVAPSVGS